MIYKYIRKKFAELPLSQKLKEECIAVIDRLAAKEQRRNCVSGKSDAIIRICQKLTKMGETINGNDIDDGLRLLEFVKALAMDIHQDSRVQVFTIKIRAYLLALRWARARNAPLAKLVSRVQLFLEQIKAAPLYETLIADYYSHIERLYLEVIREKVRWNQLIESQKLIGVCFESFKAQITAICSVFNIEEQKLHRLIQIKLQLLSQLFKFQHAVKYLTCQLEPETVTAQILPRYERITFKIPTIHFPDEKLTEQCEYLWSNKGTTIKRSSFDRMTKKSSVAMRMSEVQLERKSRHRESLQETVEYLNDFFRKRTTSAIELNFNKAALITSHNNFKKSYFQKENVENLRSSHHSVCSNKPNQRVFKQLVNKRKEKIAQLIEPKKFKLVIEMERQNKERILQMDPFKEMKAEELGLLNASKVGSRLIFFPQK